jgi:hypothetical protein
MENQFSTENQINFKQVREFGDIFNVTFAFIRENFKGLIIPLLIYVGPLVAIFGVLYGIFLTKYLGFGAFNNSSLIQYNTYNFGAGAALYLIAISFLGVLFFTLLIGIINSYIILYIEKGKGEFTHSDVFNNTLKYFFQLLLTNIITSIFVGVGTLFCFIPGIYLGISMSFMSFIVMYERKGVGHALNRTFQIANSKWWWNFLIIFVFSIITGIIGNILGLPFMIIQFLFQFGVLDNQYVDILYMFSLSGTYIVSFLTYTILFVAISFQYFSIVEEKEAPDLYGRIGQIGQDNPTTKPNQYTN